jgi:hypothetical protein
LSTAAGVDRRNITATATTTAALLVVGAAMAAPSIPAAAAPATMAWLAPLSALPALPIRAALPVRAVLLSVATTVPRFVPTVGCSVLYDPAGPAGPFVVVR